MRARPIIEAMGQAPAAGGNEARGEARPRSRRTRAIAIDGPSAAGKSAVGEAVARRLGYLFLDTGTMYRAVTWAVLEKGVRPDDERPVAKLAETLKMDVQLAQPHLDRAASVRVNGEDVGSQLRRPEIEKAVSLVSRIAGVRTALVEMQRRLAKGGPIVMSGRDIGTVVLPDADLKVYLEASLEKRAARRYAEITGSKLSTVAAELSNRDRLDSERQTSPLRPAPDAIIIETDNLTLEEAVNRVLEIVESKTG